MDCFDECTPPCTAYGILLKNQKELDARVKIAENFINEIGYSPAQLIPLTEYGTGTVIGLMFQPS